MTDGIQFLFCTPVAWWRSSRHMFGSRNFGI